MLTGYSRGTYLFIIVTLLGNPFVTTPMLWFYLRLQIRKTHPF